MCTYLSDTWALRSNVFAWNLPGVLMYIPNLPFRKVVAILYSYTAVWEFGFSPPSFSEWFLTSDKLGELFLGGKMFLVSFKDFIYLFLEVGEGGRKRGRETPMCGCLLRTLYLGAGPRPGCLPRVGMELVTLWFPGWRSFHWATPARVEEWGLM